MAESCGLSIPVVYPSMALGATEETPLEMAAAYTAFANGGMVLQPTPLKAVLQGDQGGTVVSAAAESVFSPQVAYLMTSMMESVVETGTAARLHGMGVHGAVAGKTGTSNDGWFVGYTPNLVVAVWVGYDDNTDLEMKASDCALPIWADFVRQAVEIRPELGGDKFARPSGITEVEIDPTTGLRATPECPERRVELFIAGSEPLADCTHGTPETSMDSEAGGLDDMHQDGSEVTVGVMVCRESGMAASRSCPHPVYKLFTRGEEPGQVCDLDHDALDTHETRLDSNPVREPGDSRPQRRPNRPPDNQR
jgi:membrane carboxypeptidase/penicillin-binding protein